MLSSLKVMSEEQYSPMSENDAEAVAALNIRKSICKILGGTSYAGTKYSSSIKQFKSTSSLRQKQSLLKDIVIQFNKTVTLFKAAMNVLREEGRLPKKLTNADDICVINEDVDKIFEKIMVYGNDATDEASVNSFDKSKLNRSSEDESISLSVASENTENTNTSPNLLEEKYFINDPELEDMEKDLREAENNFLEVNTGQAAPAA